MTGHIAPCNVVMSVGRIVSAAPHQRGLKAQKDSVSVYGTVLEPTERGDFNGKERRLLHNLPHLLCSYMHALRLR